MLAESGKLYQPPWFRSEVEAANDVPDKEKERETEALASGMEHANADKRRPRARKRSQHWV